MEKSRREQDHPGADFHNLSIQQKNPSKLGKELNHSYIQKKVTGTSPAIGDLSPYSPNSNSSHNIRNKEGLLDDIPVYREIKQGCPLSPLLFNLVLESIIPQVENSEGGYQFNNGSRVKILVYANGICLTGQEKDDIQRSLDMLMKFTIWAGLTVLKCGSLSLINKKGRKYVEPYQPRLGQALIPPLKWSDSYKYLGIRISRERLRTQKDLEDKIVRNVEKIMDLALTDWQKIEAVNVFVFSGLEYYLNTSIPNRLWLIRLDATIRRIVKKALKLLKRTSTAFFHISRKDGGLGLISQEDRLNIILLKRALIILSSQDRWIQDIAWAQLTSTLTCREKVKRT